MAINLIATTPRGFEYEGASELLALLREAGDESPRIERSKVAGLLLCETGLPVFEALSKIAELVRSDPGRVRRLQRLIPVEKVVRSELEDIARAAQELASRIEEGATYRVTVEKRFTALSSREIIERIASGIKRKVSLERPDWVVLVEVIGGLTAISVIRPEQVLNLRRMAEEQGEAATAKG
ncbi:MAG: hypothetical protein C4339_04640 [Nitrososphaerota archaeon]